MAENLRELAYARFTEKLFAQEIKPGEFVSQRQLSELLDVPLGPVREALKRLEAHKYVQLVAQRGVQICPIDFDLIEETFGLRIILEFAGLESFVQRASDSEIDDLIKRTERLREHLEDGSDCPDLMSEAYQTDRALHDGLIDSIGNGLVSETYDLNFAKIRLIRLNGKHLPGRSLDIMNEHLEILRALKARDMDSARSALRKHLVVSHRRALGQTGGDW